MNILNLLVPSLWAGAIAMALISGFNMKAWLGIPLAALMTCAYIWLNIRSMIHFYMPGAVMLASTVVLAAVALLGRGKPWCGWAVAAAFWLTALFCHFDSRLPRALLYLPLLYGVVAFGLAAILARSKRFTPRSGWVFAGLALVIAVVILASMMNFGMGASQAPASTASYDFSDSAIEQAVRKQLGN